MCGGSFRVNKTEAGGTLRDSARLAMKLKDGYVSIFKFHSKQKKSRVAYILPTLALREAILSFFHFSYLFMFAPSLSL